MSEVEPNIASLLSEHRVFQPPEDFQARAIVRDRSIYERAEADHEAFWAEQAERLSWSRPWDTVMEWTPPWVRWFAGGQLNASTNCLDRHVEAGGGDKVAYHWEGEPGEERTITYRELLEEVCRFANALRSLGVRKGDRVAIYLGMIPELPVAMLACARIGAAHSVVFGGFSSESLRDRINDAEATVLITADGGYRRGAVVPLKANADEALKECPTIEHVVTVRRTGTEHAFTEGRDVWYHDLVEGQDSECEPEPMDAEDLLYLLYTSGTTGKPKGIAHTTGGLPHPGRGHAPDDLRHPRRRRVLVRGGHRLGHRALVHRVWAAREPHHRDHLRGRARLAGQGSTLADRREVPRDDPVHGADGDPRVHAVGDGVPREARPVVPAAPGVGRRADQPGGLDLVLDVHRRGALPDRRHVVADGDGRDPDHAPARHHAAEARLGDVRPSPASCPTSSTSAARPSRPAAAATWC